MTHRKETATVRDPIHGDIAYSENERKVIDSPFMQRLRHVSQLGLASHLYPGAEHTRFGHTFGVMHLNGRVFDVITRQRNLSEEVRKAYPELCDEERRRYWGLAGRMGSICHDFGHLPFSHAAERKLLPKGVTHEHITLAIVRSARFQEICDSLDPRLDPEDVAKLAVGKDVYKKVAKKHLSRLETLLSEIIVGDAYGVDRMDYLPRDSHYCGVAHGWFDHHRLIGALRILPFPTASGGEDVPEIGIEIGGLRSAEALLMARYLTYTQVYFHRVSKIYDIHLADFMKARPEFAVGFPLDLDRFLKVNDSHVIALMERAAADPGEPGHEHARRIVRREHFKLVHESLPGDFSPKSELGKQVYEELVQRFGEEMIRDFRKLEKRNPAKMPVRLRDGRIVSSAKASGVMRNTPKVKVHYVYADRMIAEEARAWLKRM